MKNSMIRPVLPYATPARINATSRLRDLLFSASRSREWMMFKRCILLAVYYVATTIIVDAMTTRGVGRGAFIAFAIAQFVVVYAALRAMECIERDARQCAIADDRDRQIPPT